MSLQCACFVIVRLQPRFHSLYPPIDNTIWFVNVFFVSIAQRCYITQANQISDRNFITANEITIIQEVVPQLCDAFGGAFSKSRDFIFVYLLCWLDWRYNLNDKVEIKWCLYCPFITSMDPWFTDNVVIWWLNYDQACRHWLHVDLIYRYVYASPNKYQHW